MKQVIIKLHISILLAGATGLFGKLITLNEGLLVWYRMLLASGLFFLFLVVSKRFRRISVHDFIRIAGVGFLIALHWVFFYGSIKASNVSVGVVSFSTVGFFTALFEPLILKRKIRLREFIYSFISLLGVCLIFSLDVRYRLGIGLGVISGALASLLPYIPNG